MSVFAKGVLTVIGVMGALFGMVYLLLTMVLGARLAYWLEGAITFGILVIMSAIWSFSALGPAGPDTQWQAIAIGPDLKTVNFKGTNYNVADYPNGSNWKSPKVGDHMADLKGSGDTDSEAAQAKPVIDSLVANAVSTIEGQRTQVQPLVQGDVALTPGGFTASNFKMQPVKVKGKDSIIAVALAVPSKAITATLPPGVTEGNVKEYLVQVGQKVAKGQDLLVISTPSGDVKLQAADTGDIVVQSLRPGDKVRPGLPIATIGLAGQETQPPPVVVAAVRVRGSLRTPAVIYLLVSIILFIVHLAGLKATEKDRKASLATATA